MSGAILHKLHLDLSSGIAGDMFLAACLDLGVEREELIRALAGLNLPPWSLETQREQRGGMSGLRLTVAFPHEHAHRRLPEILERIDGAGFPPLARDRAGAMFRTLAEAEGAVHGLAPEEVHFHEVGAVDALVDICGAAWALWRLGVEEATASALAVGSGVVRCDHGVMPVPAPATAEILRRFGVPILSAAGEGELATPTGAAILVNTVSAFGVMTLERIDRVGVGLGRRELADRANALRILAEEKRGVVPRAVEEGIDRERVAVLSTHVDDMNPEWYGPLWEVLFQAGALDVALIPLTMKKGRPAVRLEVVASEERAEPLARLILAHTTTLGVRLERMERLALHRERRTVETPWGALRVVLAGGSPRLEHDDLAALARRQGWSLPHAAMQVQPFLQSLSG
ncbi:MAG: nickel pincer cofactor biosynthesis protein LarC [Magnetococcales bacterium]|nr:nickel pincer cofactor biosynthesis protein LarC [Magnetococcales bacterium]